MAGLYMQVREFDDLAGMEAINTRVFIDETMKPISRRFHQLVDPVTCPTGVWRPIATR